MDQEIERDERAKRTPFDPIFLQSEHVKIRPLAEVSWQSLADALLYEGSFHARNWGLRTPEDIQKKYQSWCQAAAQSRGHALVFLNLDETEILGMTNFMNIEPSHKMLEIGGTWINPKWQRSFVNSETKYALLNYIFTKLNYHRVEFRIDSENVTSQKAVERLGFDCDGRLPRRKINANGESRDYFFYSVTDLTWPRVQKRILELLKDAKKPEYKSIQASRRLCRNGEYEAAFEVLNQALKEYPESGILNYEIACLCDGHRTEAEAVDFYLAALQYELNAEDRSQALLGLGSTYRSLGQYAESEIIFEQGLKEFPGYRPFQVFLALTEFNLGDYASCVQRLIEQLLQTTRDREIQAYRRALEFYSTRLQEVFS